MQEGCSWQGMPGERVELSRGCPRRILSPLRLPFRHPGGRVKLMQSTPLLQPARRTQDLLHQNGTPHLIRVAALKQRSNGVGGRDLAWFA